MLGVVTAKCTTGPNTNWELLIVNYLCERQVYVSNESLETEGGGRCPQDTASKECTNSAEDIALIPSSAGLMYCKIVNTAVASGLMLLEISLKTRDQVLVRV